jgi:hypothetical protein
MQVQAQATDPSGHRGPARSLPVRCRRLPGLFPRELCLITGAPRSGTTALINWLGRQPGILGFQESRILVGVHRFLEEVHRFKNLDHDRARIYSLARNLVFDYYASVSRLAVGKKLLVDKEPLEPIAFPAKEYGPFLANVRQLFPEARILYTVRDPIATIGSMVGRTWGESLTSEETRQFTLEEHIENWCSCAELALQCGADPHIYIVQFGRLVNDPENESRKIFDFLKLRRGNSFQPRPTHAIRFSQEERERILRLVQPQIERLDARGISDL